MATPRSHFPDAAAARAPMARRDWSVLALLTLLGAGLRWLHWERTPAMFNDGPRFLAQAASFFRGDWAAGIGDVYHPLYAVATAAAMTLFGPAEPQPAQWEDTAAAVSIVAGAGGVVAFYFFVRSAFGPETGWIGAALLAVHPITVEFSSDVQSDGLYHALLLAAVALLWSGLARGSAGRAALGGVAGGLAYLTRPEGLGVIGVAGLVGAGLVLSRRWSPLQGLGWGAALVAGALLLVAPYVLALHRDTGVWTLTQKKSVTALVGTRDPGMFGPTDQNLEPGAQVEFTAPVDAQIRKERRRRSSEAETRAPTSLSYAWGTVLRVLDSTASALRPEVLVFIVVGIAAVGLRPGLRGIFVIGVLAIYAAAVLALTATHGYVSRRHVLPPASLLLGYAAFGVPVVGRGIAAAFGRLRSEARPARAGTATALGLALLVALALGKQMRPISPAGVAEREAAEWLRRTMSPAGPVAADRLRVAYYAGAPWFPLRKVPDRVRVGELLRSNGVRFVIADEGDLDRHPQLADPSALGDRVIHRVEANGTIALVYDLGASEGD